MINLPIGACVRMKSGGPVMTVEAERSDGQYTMSYMTDLGMRSVLLPGEAVVVVQPETVDANRLPTAISALEERVAAIEDKVSARGYDTRPMYEVHEEKIQQLEARIEKLEQRRQGSEEPTKEF